MGDTATLDAPTVAERVAAGVAWLDQHDPGWWREDAQGRGEPHESGPIDLGRLLMRNPCRCVLGFRWGHFGEAPIGIAESVALGFDAEDRDGRAGSAERDYEALGVEWERVITDRREAERARVLEVTSDGA